MKRLVLSLVISGVLLVAIGVGLWVDSNNVLGWRDYGAVTGKWDEYSNYVARKGVGEAVGAGLAVIGGSMAVAGGIMIYRRSQYNVKS